jgi:hypothetical protein
MNKAAPIANVAWMTFPSVHTCSESTAAPKASLQNFISDAVSLQVSIGMFM